jgi:hypothetical protein
MIADQVKLSERKRLELEARIDRSNRKNLWEQKYSVVSGSITDFPVDVRAGPVETSHGHLCSTFNAVT